MSPKMTMVLAAVLIVVAGLCYTFMGLYSVQPIGMLPEGRTLLVWRAGDEPFFNSPDATCERRVGSVSLFCRMAAMGAAPLDRIIVRLPYQDWAYGLSVDGEYER